MEEWQISLSLRLLRKEVFIHLNGGLFLVFKKEFKTIDEQIQILKKRGLTINDIESASRYLLTNNYYNIINGYSKPFLEEKEKYINGASFDEVSRLYFFDKEIKQTLFNAILDAEHHLKSLFAHRFAEIHKGDPEAYLNVSAYNDDYSQDIAWTITNFARIIRSNRRYDNNSIKYYIDNYGAVPIWVIVDYLNFGDLLTLIKISPISLQNKIAEDLISFIKANNPDFHKKFSPRVMISFIKNIHETRNICAHNNRLIYSSCRADGKYFKYLHSQYNIKPEDSRNTVYTTFISLQCFISRTEYAKLNNTIRKRMKTLDNHLFSIETNSILDLLGFPNNWYNLPPIQQG